MQGHRCKRVSLRATVVLLLAELFPTAARADEFYYVMVFGSQRSLPAPNYAHTFAVFVKATGSGPCVDRYWVEARIISWLPANLKLRVTALMPEYGVNLGLYETLKYVRDNDERVSMWGPYQIDRAFYFRALRRIDELESGSVLYKSNDAFRAPARVTNCIHAVSAVENGAPLVVFSPGWGETASYYVTRSMEPWIIDCNRKHEWVAKRLRLDCYPIIRRELENPRSGLINTLLGRDPLER
jgi:hypothetical protein